MRKAAAVLLLWAASAAAQTGPLYVVGGVIDFGAVTSETRLFRTVVALPGACTVTSLWWRTSDNTLWYCSALNTFTQFGTGGAQTHVFNCPIGTFGGSTVISLGDANCYAPNGFNGTINRVDLIAAGAALATCSITLDVWYKTTTGLPTGANIISAAAPATVTTANTAYNQAILGTWTTGITAPGTFNANVASVTGCTAANLNIYF